MALKKQVFGELDVAGEAGRDPGHEHVDARHRRDRRGDVAARRRSSACTSSARRTSCGCSRSCAARRRRRRRLPPALALAKRLGKVGVVVGNAPGFVGNRMMFPYMYEAQFLVEDGATPEQVDRALTDFGMAMGIFAVDDMAGLDVAWRVRQELNQFSEPGARKPLVADTLCEMGRFGQKTGQRLVSLRRRPQADSRSRGRRADRADWPRDAGIARRDVHQRGDHRAHDLRADQRRARACSRKASPCAPPTSTSSTSTATASRPIAAGRCSTRTASGCATIHDRVAAFHRELGDALGAGAAAGAPGARRLDVPRVGCARAAAAAAARA